MIDERIEEFKFRKTIYFSDSADVMMKEINPIMKAAVVDDILRRVIQRWAFLSLSIQRWIEALGRACGMCSVFFATLSSGGLQA